MNSFECLQRTAIFSKLDLRNAYNLARICEGDKWKIAFNTHSSHYETPVLQEMLEKLVFVYLDDF